ncbi:nuclear transport factor 2 family protein [Streptomyces sp. NPDC059957]|uniref:nuclear transport factor 2 family protein n=1 Tax=unclassified Streptomyces TaxID=2593676 RepID=UPI00364AFDDD
MIKPDQLSDPAVRAFVDAVNENDRVAFQAALTADATMADDGSERDITGWADKEIFAANGHMTVEKQDDEGRSLIVSFRNDIWGEMRTAWRFTVAPGGLVSRFETGQA